MSKYFRHFKPVYYADRLATNILSRVKIDDQVANDMYIYYPYQIKQGERADNIAANYYGDPGLDWIVYFSNRIHDPYFEWPLEQNDFNQVMINRYGTVEEAQSTIAFFRVNWYNDDSVLSPAAYAALNAPVKKYWKPVYGLSNAILSYERKPLDLIVETNRTINLICTTSGLFKDGERIIQRDDNGVQIAAGVVSFASRTLIVVTKVVGTFIANKWIRGLSSNETADCSSVIIANRALSDEEVSYWEPVSYYQYEDELNTSRRSIYLIDKRYVNAIEKQMRELLL